MRVGIPIMSSRTGPLWRVPGTKYGFEQYGDSATLTTGSGAQVTLDTAAIPWWLFVAVGFVMGRATAK